MNTQCGIWLDHHQAKIVNLYGSECSVVTIESAVENRHRSTGGFKGKQPYVHRSVNSSSRSDTRRKNEWHRHYENIADKIPDHADVFIMGPGPAKIDFRKFIHLRSAKDINIVGVESSKKQTTRQLIAKVKLRFGITNRIQRFQ